MVTVPDAFDRFDRDLIGQYRSVIGPNGAREMVELFLRRLDDRRSELAVAVAADDMAEIRRVGHASKGMASAVGAVRLSAAGEALQHAEAADVRRLLAEFDAEAEAATADVRAAWGLTNS
jgi:HPt (histidine-containing phosphotransfer) domain-containing protein